MVKWLVQKRNRYFFFFFLAAVFVFLTFEPNHFFIPFINGDDYVFHFYRIESMTNDLKNAGYPCYLSPFGPGAVLYGVNLFYPFLTTVLPIALLNMCLHSVIASVDVYLIGLNFATLLISYQTTVYFVKKVKPSLTEEQISLHACVFAVLYLFSSYRLVTIFTRFALGEAVAMTFLPLIFVGFYDIIFQKGEKRHWLVWGMVGLAYTHLLSLELVTILLLFLFLLAVPLWSFKKVKQLFFSGLLFIGLSAASIFVTLEQMMHIKLKSVDEYPLAENAKSVGRMLKEGLKNDLSSYSLGIWIIIILLIGVGICIFSWKRVKEVLWLPFLIGIGLFLISSNLFPWAMMQHTPLKLMQFQFRLFPYITYFLLLFGVEMAFTLIPHHPKIVSSFLVGSTLLLAFLSVAQLKMDRTAQKMIVPAISYSDKEAQSTRLYQIYYNLDYIADIPEEAYMSIFGKIGKVDKTDTPMDYQVQGAQTKIEVVTENENEKVTLPIVAYKGVSVFEGKKELQTKKSSYGTIEVWLPNTGHHNLLIRFQPPLGMIMGYLLTVVTLIGYVYDLYRNKKKTSNFTHL